MGAINEIVDVQITSETKAVSQQGFSTVLMLSASPVWADRIRFYTTAAAALEDTPGFTADEIAAVNAAFSQSPGPVRIAVGRQGAGPETSVQALDAILAANSLDWYGLVSSNKVKADVLLIAAWAEANKKMFATSSSVVGDYDVAVLDDVGSQLQDLAYKHTVVIWSAGAASTRLEIGILAQILALNPGSATFKFKTVPGAVPDALTTTQSSVLRGKNYNTYETIGGVAIFRDGVTASGEYADVTLGIDWLISEMVTGIYSRLVNLPKVPYTDAGVAIIQSEIRTKLKKAQGQNYNFIRTDPPFTVDAPKVVDIDFNDKANRHLPDVTFLAYLASAIHSVAVRGVVTL